jgi:hypothetical protein
MRSDSAWCTRCGTEFRRGVVEMSRQRHQWCDVCLTDEEAAQRAADVELIPEDTRKQETA